MHLLIVEDEPLIRSDLRGILEEAGYQVKEAGKADDAILLLEEDGITAVLTDIEMPGTLNGLDLAWMIRVRWRTTPVVVTSGCVLPKRDQFPANTPMLTKPFLAERLLDVVKQAT